MAREPRDYWQMPRCIEENQQTQGPRHLRELQLKPLSFCCFFPLVLGVPANQMDKVLKLSSPENYMKIKRRRVRILFLLLMKQMIKSSMSWTWWWVSYIICVNIRLYIRRYLECFHHPNWCRILSNGCRRVCIRCPPTGPTISPIRMPFLGKSGNLFGTYAKSQKNQGAWNSETCCRTPPHLLNPETHFSLFYPKPVTGTFCKVFTKRASRMRRTTRTTRSTRTARACADVYCSHIHCML